MIDVMLNVNDHRNGIAMGWIEAVHIDDLIQLDGPGCWDDEDEEKAQAGDLDGLVKFEANRTTVTIGGATFRYRRYFEWMGNWCWDMAQMDAPTVLELLNHLKRLGWDCNEAESSLFARWRELGDLTMEDLERAGMEVVKGGQR